MGAIILAHERILFFKVILEVYVFFGSAVPMRRFSVEEAGASVCWGAQGFIMAASLSLHRLWARGLSSCSPQAWHLQPLECRVHGLQQLWPMGLVVPWGVWNLPRRDGTVSLYWRVGRRIVPPGKSPYSLC